MYFFLQHSPQSFEFNFIIDAPAATCIILYLYVQNKFQIYYE